MSVKEDIIITLESNIGQEVSEQLLMKNSGLTAYKIQKAIQELKKDGYNITTTQSKGYMLDINCDIISSPGILSNSDGTPWHIVVLDSVDSTNSYAKSILKELNDSPAIIIARKQTAGRGRNGHSFYSPYDTGIYMSIVISPKISPATIITAAAAVAVCLSCEELTGSRPKIKWVNDIFIDNKKICGILTEGIIDIKTNTINKAIIGIGINLHTKEFPDEIANIAGSLHPKSVTRNMLIGRVATHLNNLLSKTAKEIISEYKNRLMVLNQNISYILNGKVHTGIALDINDIGNLIVKTDNGIDVLTAGEISLNKDF